MSGHGRENDSSLTYISKNLMTDGHPKPALIVAIFENMRDSLPRDNADAMKEAVHLADLALATYSKNTDSYDVKVAKNPYSGPFVGPSIVATQERISAKSVMKGIKNS